jgi:hypothetical protein
MSLKDLTNNFSHTAIYKMDQRLKPFYLIEAQIHILIGYIYLLCNITYFVLLWRYCALDT